MTIHVWPPDYLREFKRRMKVGVEAAKDPQLQADLMAHYKNNPKDFIHDWGVTFDPRKRLLRTMPFVMFERQNEFVDFIYGCMNDGENGLVEKSRDMGASWVCVAISVHLWLFEEGVAVGWGSRKKELVDNLGDMKAIFPKIRLQLENLPPWMLPKRFDMRKHATDMKIINPQNDASITGEAGDNIGRGGRTFVYFVDEAAHLERAENVEGALGDNTECQIAISSVNGTANLFYRRRMAGEVWEPDKTIASGRTRIFIMDWRDHPGKDQEWYDKRRQRAEDESLLHLLAQEVDRDYQASIEGSVIPAAWVKSARDALDKLGYDNFGMVSGAMDVGDGGMDKNSVAIKKGIQLRDLEEWPGIDTTISAQRGVNICRRNRSEELYYDCIGVGAGIKGETNRLKKKGDLPKGLSIYKWDASAPPLNPTATVSMYEWQEDEESGTDYDYESKTNADFYASLKSQGWWELRMRFFKTHKAVTEGAKYDIDELISIPSSLPHLHQLENELSQPTFQQNGSGKIVIDKKPPGTKSPNLADSVMMLYHPCKQVFEFEMHVI